MRLVGAVIIQDDLVVVFVHEGVREALILPIAELPISGRIEWIAARVEEYLEQHILESGGEAIFPTAPGLGELAAQLWGDLPAWAHWTPDEAQAWIEENVTDLPTAKAALATMARAIAMLRDLTIAR